MNIAAESSETSLLRFSRRAMATTFEVAFPFGSSHAESIAAEAFELIDLLESQLSVYRETSEVSRLNRIAVQAPVPISPNLHRLLRTCQQLSDATGGAFDITAGPLIKAWGFFHGRGRVPADTELLQALSLVGMKNIQLHDSPPTVRYRSTGVEINFGSIGKGYALDLVAERVLNQRGVTSALLHGGTSSVLAFGSDHWTVGVRDPDGSGRLGTIALRSRAMATSGATHQHFRHQGDKHGHLLDPRTGRPANGVALAVALASTAAKADALATAFYVMGIEATQSYCERDREVAALMVPIGDDPTVVEINIGSDWYESRCPETHAGHGTDE